MIEEPGPDISVGSRVWACSDDPELVWIDGEVSQIQGEDATVVLTNGKTISVKLNNLEMKDTKLPEKGVEDMTKLAYLHEPGVLQNLALRYLNNDIYTYVGNILIAVNPFQRVPHLIGEELMQRYKGKNLNEMPPHIFALGDVAYRAMINEQKCHSVLFSGEIGAGKTETTKLLMRYLTFIGGTTDSGERTVEQKLLQSNCILEAFGNAKTVRNNNSSRFCKFVEIQFNERGQISGAALRTYLLEKSRVCQIGTCERSYHVFYFLCAAPAEDKERFKVGDPRHFHYLSQSHCFQLDDINDYQEYMGMRNAMDIVGINVEEQDAIFRVLAAILHLGNVNFSEGEEPDLSQIKDDQSRFHLNTAAELLKVDVAKIEKAMIYKRIITRGGNIDKELDPNSAVVCRDGLAKTIYSRLFDWLVDKINVSIGQDPKSKIMIGVLDICGFESFETNSFEQLCISLGNEKLQQLFIQHVFKMEQDEYNKEEINWSNIEFTDNQDVLNLIEKIPGGVLYLLNESCMLPRATYETFATSMYNKLKGHKRFSKPKLSRTAFTVSHFAGDVTYQSEQFLDKNKDYVVPEQNELLNESKCSFVSNLFPNIEGFNSAKFNSFGTRFKMQLNCLMALLNDTEPHYVRCLKPNNLLRPMIFQNKSILQQLQCGGVFEAIKISCLGFPTRMTFAEFLKRFKVLGPNLGDGLDQKEACLGILDKYGLQHYQIGKTRVFLRAGQMAQLDLRRTVVLECEATKIERKWKTYSTRKKYLRLRKVSVAVRAACREPIDPKKEKNIKIYDETSLDNSSSPYYLHHSDNPGAVLVTQPLMGDNYSTWSQAISMALEAKNKLGFIDGSILKPDKDAPNYQLWIRCNSLVFSWILNVLSPEIANSINYVGTAREVWIYLHDRFSQKNAARIFEIRRSIYNHRQGSNSVSTYYTILKGFWDDLSSYTSFPSCTCGAIKNHADLQQTDHLMQFLIGLNDSYADIRSQILLMDPLPSINFAYLLLLKEERKRSPHDNNVKTVEQSTTEGIKHTSNAHVVSQSQQGKKPASPCYFCDKDECTESRCFKKHDYLSCDGNKFHETQRLLATVTATGKAPAITLTFTPDQYNQLLSLVSSGNSTTLANLAGTSLEERTE